MGQENTPPETNNPAESRPAEVVGTAPVAKPFYQRWWEGLGKILDGRLGSVTDAAAKTLHGEKGEVIHENYVKQGMPWVAGLAAGLGALTLADPITRGAQTLTGGLSNMARKVPLIGAPIGWLIDRIGDMSGVLLSGVAALVAFKAFMPTAKTYSDFHPDATVDTPNSGTGAVAQPALRQDMAVQRPQDKTPDAKESVPIAPMPVANPEIPPHMMSAPDQAVAVQMSYPELRQKRARAIEDEHKDLQEAYRSLMQAENQRFENRAQFVKEARAFEGEPRQKMVKSLDQHVGLSREEAEGLVVKAPKLRATVYPGASETQDHKGGDGVTKDGNTPEALVKFAREFETHYGKGFVWVAHKDGSGWQSQTRMDGRELDAKGLPVKRGIPFDEMSTTQKTEYIEKAIHFTKSRYEFFEHHCGYEYDANGPALDGIAVPAARTKSYDYTDMSHSARPGTSVLAPIIGYFSKSPVAQGEQFPAGWKSWESEHKFLQGLNGDTSSSGSKLLLYGLGGSYDGPEIGSGLKDLKSGFGGYEQLLDSYKATLKHAETAHNGEIKIYKDRVQTMEQSLALIRKSGVALLGVSQAKGVDVLHIRDVRAFDPTKQNRGDTRLIDWHGLRDGQRFAVRAVEIDGRKIELGESFVVNLKTGDGADKALKAIDEKLASFALAARQGEGLRLPSQDVASAPDTPSGSPRIVAATDKTKPVASASHP